MLRVQSIAEKGGKCLLMVVLRCVQQQSRNGKTCRRATGRFKRPCLAVKRLHPRWQGPGHDVTQLCRTCRASHSTATAASVALAYCSEVGGGADREGRGAVGCAGPCWAAATRPGRSRLLVHGTLRCGHKPLPQAAPASFLYFSISSTSS